jgi:hypothetical protein
MDFAGGDIQKYEQVIEKMGLRAGGPGPTGILFHWVTRTDDGIRVTDVWESPEQFQKFAEEQIGPFTQEVGLPQPSMQTYEVHNYFTKG